MDRNAGTDGTTPAGQQPALGQALSAAIVSDFFTWFHLVAYEPAKGIGGGHTWHGFRPDGSRFQDLVTLNLEIDPAGDVDRLTLCLDRNFLSRPADCPFARDIAKSFLSWALPMADQLSVAALIQEIADISRCGATVIRRADMPVPDLPRFPSPGYRTFLGYEGEFDIDLKDSHLRIVNLNWSRRQAEMITPPGYDGETMWMWLIVRRRQ